MKLANKKKNVLVVVNLKMNWFYFFSLYSTLCFYIQSIFSQHNIDIIICNLILRLDGYI